MKETTESFEASLSFKLTPTELSKKAGGGVSGAKDVAGDKGDKEIKEAGGGAETEEADAAGVSGKQFTIGGEIGIEKTKKEKVTQLNEYKLDKVRHINVTGGPMSSRLST